MGHNPPKQREFTFSKYNRSYDQISSIIYPDDPLTCKRRWSVLYPRRSCFVRKTRKRSLKNEKLQQSISEHLGTDYGQGISPSLIKHRRHTNILFYNHQNQDERSKMHVHSTCNPFILPSRLIPGVWGTSFRSLRSASCRCNRTMYIQWSLNLIYTIQKMMWKWVEIKFPESKKLSGLSHTNISVHLKIAKYNENFRTFVDRRSLTLLQILRETCLKRNHRWLYTQQYLFRIVDFQLVQEGRDHHSIIKREITKQSGLNTCVITAHRTSCNHIWNRLSQVHITAASALQWSFQKQFSPWCIFLNMTGFPCTIMKYNRKTISSG